jgi:hypothetical protein
MVGFIVHVSVRQEVASFFSSKTFYSYVHNCDVITIKMAEHSLLRLQTRHKEHH